MASTHSLAQLKAQQKSPDMTGLKTPSTQLQQQQQEDNKRTIKPIAMSYGTVEVFFDHGICLFKTF